VLLLLANTGR